MTRGQLATHSKYFLFGVLMLPGLWATPDQLRLL